MNDVGPRVGMKLVKEPNGNDYMAVICENFDNAMLRTTNEPLLLANKDGRNLALQLTTSSLIPNRTEGEQTEAGENKILFYCWMMELPK